MCDRTFSYSAQVPLLLTIQVLNLGISGHSRTSHLCSKINDIALQHLQSTNCFHKRKINHYTWLCCKRLHTVISGNCLSQSRPVSWKQNKPIPGLKHPFNRVSPWSMLLGQGVSYKNTPIKSATFFYRMVPCGFEEYVLDPNYHKIPQGIIYFFYSTTRVIHSLIMFYTPDSKHIHFSINSNKNMHFVFVGLLFPILPKCS